MTIENIQYGKITEFVHFLIKKSYDGLNDIIAVDATAGNGNDTNFLCEICRNNGFVYAFDVQDAAIKNTNELLKKNNYNNYKLILDSHENLDKYMLSTTSQSNNIDEFSACKNIDICIFNLGYLPNYDKQVRTKYETSIKAIEKAINLLSENGRIYISAYLLHDKGEEASHILEYISDLDKRIYNVLQIKLLNKNNMPPEIYIIEKKVA